LYFYEDFMRKIILLDDHSLFLNGMKLILKNHFNEFDISTYQSIQKLNDDNLDFSTFNLLISDIDLPGENTFDFFTSLKTEFKELPILVVSMHKKNAIIKRCKTIGIDGYILKDEDHHLIPAVENVLNGKKYYSEIIMKHYLSTQDSKETLSNREEEILQLMAKGLNNQDLAKKVSISIETIKTHKKNIRLKLGLKTQLEIIEYVKENFLS